MQLKSQYFMQICMYVNICIYICVLCVPVSICEGDGDSDVRTHCWLLCCGKLNFRHWVPSVCTLECQYIQTYAWNTHILMRTNIYCIKQTGCRRVHWHFNVKLSSFGPLYALDGIPHATIVFFFSLWFIYHTSILPPLLLILLFSVRYLRELSQLAVYFASAFLRLFAIYRVHWLRWSKAKRLLLLISIQLGRSNNQQQ